MLVVHGCLRLRQGHWWLSSLPSRLPSEMTADLPHPGGESDGRGGVSPGHAVPLGRCRLPRLATAAAKPGKWPSIAGGNIDRPGHFRAGLPSGLLFQGAGALFELLTTTFFMDPRVKNGCCQDLRRLHS